MGHVPPFRLENADGRNTHEAASTQETMPPAPSTRRQRDPFDWGESAIREKIRRGREDSCSGGDVSGGVALRRHGERRYRSTRRHAPSTVIASFSLHASATRFPSAPPRRAQRLVVTSQVAVRATRAGDASGMRVVPRRGSWPGKWPAVAGQRTTTRGRRRWTAVGAPDPSDYAAEPRKGSRPIAKDATYR